MTDRQTQDEIVTLKQLTRLIEGIDFYNTAFRRAHHIGSLQLHIDGLPETRIFIDDDAMQAVREIVITSLKKELTEREQIYNDLKKELLK